jgi:hypothetical protein
MRDGLRVDDADAHINPRPAMQIVGRVANACFQPRLADLAY